MEDLNGIEEFFSALQSAAKRDSMIEDLCAIIGMLMQRNGIKEASFDDAEFQKLVDIHDDSGLEIERVEEQLIVRFGKGASEAASRGAHVVN